jgi:hypothetical protein
MQDSSILQSLSHVPTAHITLALSFLFPTFAIFVTFATRKQWIPFRSWAFLWFAALLVLVVSYWTHQTGRAAMSASLLDASVLSHHIQIAQGHTLLWLAILVLITSMPIWRRSKHNLLGMLIAVGLSIAQALVAYHLLQLSPAQ